MPALFSLLSVPAPQHVSGASVLARPGVFGLGLPDQSLLASWAGGRVRRVAKAAVGGLRFAFYWRVSTEDHQDPVTSRAWQLGQALATIAGEGRIVVEFSDVGQSRTVAPQRRPGMAALLAALEDPNRGFDAVVIGSNERAFCGNHYSLVAPLLASHGVQLWMPELGGRVDPSIDTVEELMDLLGILARREVMRARARVTNAMTVQVRDQGRYEGGRVLHGYLLVDAGPHPNRREAKRGVRLHTFGIDPTAATTIEWIFAMRLQEFSLARITRALNDAAIPCPSAADPESNPHRTGAEWTLGTVREILQNPVYTGRMVWGRTRTDRDLIDPANLALGRTEVRRRNNPDQWVISERRTHPALISEADFIAVQALRAKHARAKHDYRLKGLLRCTVCGRSFEGHWVNKAPAIAAGTAIPAPKTPARPGRRTFTCVKTGCWPSCRCSTTDSPSPNRPRSLPALLPAPPAPFR
ncbi:recombinase family protein [Catenulispora yoronensis]